MRRIVAVSALLFTFGCGNQPAETATREAVVPQESSGHLALTADEVRGQELYHSLCWTCHGRSGHGAGPAAGEAAERATQNENPDEDARIPV